MDIKKVQSLKSDAEFLDNFFMNLIVPGDYYSFALPYEKDVEHNSAAMFDTTDDSLESKSSMTGSHNIVFKAFLRRIADNTIVNIGNINNKDLFWEFFLDYINENKVYIMQHISRKFKETARKEWLSSRKEFEEYLNFFDIKDSK